MKRLNVLEAIWCGVYYLFSCLFNKFQEMETKNWFLPKHSWPDVLSHHAVYICYMNAELFTASLLSLQNRQRKVTSLCSLVVVAR